MLVSRGISELAKTYEEINAEFAQLCYQSLEVVPSCLYSHLNFEEILFCRSFLLAEQKQPKTHLCIIYQVSQRVGSYTSSNRSI